jgi:hypothetical protein
MTDQATSLLVLTDEESRLIRKALGTLAIEANQADALRAYNRGMVRGTERLAAEVKQNQNQKRRV